MFDSDRFHVVVTWAGERRYLAETPDTGTVWRLGDRGEALTLPRAQAVAASWGFRRARSWRNEFEAVDVEPA